MNILRSMDLYWVIMFIVAANTIPLTGISTAKQNILLGLFSIWMGAEGHYELVWVDGTIYITSEHSVQSIFYSNTFTPDSAPGVLDKVNQLPALKRFIAIDQATNTVRLYLDFVSLQVEDVRVFIDGELTQWNPSLRCFEYCPNTENATLRNTNAISINTHFDGVSFEVRTNGVPIKRLQFDTVG